MRIRLRATLHAPCVLLRRRRSLDSLARCSPSLGLAGKGLEANPRSRYIIQSWACMAARSGHSEEASKLFMQATRKGARPDGATWQARALQHAREGRVGAAREAFEAGVALDPGHVPLYHAWGQ